MMLWPKPWGMLHNSNTKFQWIPTILIWFPCSHGTAHKFQVNWLGWVWVLVVRHRHWSE